MRPTDEDQPGTRRPNLMPSTRRPGGEINILAMLEGRSGRKPGKRLPAWPAAIWYGSAAVLACALACALAWMAHEVNGVGRQASGGVTVAEAQQPPAATEAAADAGQPVAEHGAAPAAAPYDDHTPAMDAFPPYATVAAAAHDSTGPLASNATPAPAPARQAALASTPAKSALPRPVAAYRPAPQPIRPAAQPRARRVAAQPQPVLSSVDLDVALISAIIQHGGRPDEAGEPGATASSGAGRSDAQGRGGATCASKSCGPHMPDQP